MGRFSTKQIVSGNITHFASVKTARDKIWKVRQLRPTLTRRRWLSSPEWQQALLVDCATAIHQTFWRPRLDIIVRDTFDISCHTKNYVYNCRFEGILFIFFLFFLGDARVSSMWRWTKFGLVQIFYCYVYCVVYKNYRIINNRLET